jgi:hypothetical protein
MKLRGHYSRGQMVRSPRGHEIFHVRFEVSTAVTVKKAVF